jgi:O-antigen/teichoic acid export membrane protein
MDRPCEDTRAVVTLTKRPLGGLQRNITASVLTAAALVASALISTPIILSAVGTSAYGVWTLGQTMVLFIVVADAGLGPSVVRFTAIRGEGNRPGVAQLLWTAWATYAALGGCAIAAAIAGASEFTAVFDVSASLANDAQTMLRILGIAVAFALLSAAAGNVLQGLERFTEVAGTAAGSSLVFLVSVAAFMGQGAGLRGLALAAVIQQGCGLTMRLWLLRAVIRSTRPRLLPRSHLREFFGFAARLQMNVLGTLVNNQSDKVVVGIVTRPIVVGQIGIASQTAEAARAVCGSALSPMVSRMSAAHGAADGAEVKRLFLRLSHTWLVCVLGGTTIALSVIHPVVLAWLGPGHGSAAMYAQFLLVAVGAHLATGVGTAYLRAIGVPGLEARYGAFIIAVNLSLSIVLGIALGAVGVVAATAVAYVAGGVFFFRRLRTASPLGTGLPTLDLLRATPAALVSGALAFAWCAGVSELVPHGLALVPAALGVVGAFVGYCAWAQVLRLRTPRRSLSGGP